eukprot:7373290-Pyramimonas_sp.AAC.1
MRNCSLVRHFPRSCSGLALPPTTSSAEPWKSVDPVGASSLEGFSVSIDIERGSARWNILL